MLIAVVAAFSLARMGFWGSATLATGVFLTYLIPDTLLFIPLFKIFAWFHDVTGIELINHGAPGVRLHPQPKRGRKAKGAGSRPAAATSTPKRAPRRTATRAWDGAAADQPCLALGEHLKGQPHRMDGPARHVGRYLQGRGAGQRFAERLLDPVEHLHPGHDGTGLGRNSRHGCPPRDKPSNVGTA